MKKLFNAFKGNTELKLSDVGGSDIIDLILRKVEEGKVAVVEGTSVKVGEVSIDTAFLTDDEVLKISSAISARDAALIQKQRREQLMNLCIQLSNA